MSADDDNSGRATANRNIRSGSQSAQRTVDLLLSVAHSAEGRTPSELAQLLSVDRQIVYHLLHTLKTTGWVCVDDAGRWRIGHACAAIEMGLAKRAQTPKVSIKPITSPPPGAWLTIAGEDRTALLSTIRGRAAIEALAELSSHWDFRND